MLISFYEKIFSVLEKILDDTGVEPVTSRMLSARDNQLHQSPKLL